MLRVNFSILLILKFYLFILKIYFYHISHQYYFTCYINIQSHVKLICFYIYYFDSNSFINFLKIF